MKRPSIYGLEPVVQELNFFTVIQGPTKEHYRPDDCVIFAGKLSELKKTSFYETFTTITNETVTEALWRTSLAVAEEKKRPTIPLHLNSHKLIVLPDAHSRYAAPSNAHVLSAELKKAEVEKESNALRIILFTNTADTVALISAIARAFPLYGRSSDFQPVDVVVELISSDEPLSPSDLNIVADIACSVRLAARLSDMPANELTTAAYVEEAERVARRLVVNFKVLKGEQLNELGFGGLYSVGHAGPTPPAFVVLSHEPVGAVESFALVGKGIVYDTGGVNLKSMAEMPGMKRDMSGSASLLGAFITLVKARFQQKLHLCLCLAENSINERANKPDDIITLLSGRTVEITNTDCEGRLVLADGVYYAKHELKARHIINMATLTYAQEQMTGKTHAAVMCSEAASEAKVVAAGLAAGEPVHPMIYAPDLHAVDLRSGLADMNNCFFGTAEAPRSASAALFVGSNIDYGEGLDWIHVDMLGPSHREGRSTGWGVAFVTSLLGEHTTSPLLQSLAHP